MEKVLFNEEQRYDQRRLTLLMLTMVFVAVGPFIYGIYSQEVLNKPFGDKSTSTESLVLICSLSVLMIGLTMLILFKIRLKTKITNEALWISYPPIRKKWKKIAPEEIEKYEIRTYRAKREYGGHGMKRRIRSGMSYTVSGNIGLQLYFKNGKKLLVGTQKKQAIEYAMEKIIKGENSV